MAETSQNTTVKCKKVYKKEQTDRSDAQTLWDVGTRGFVPNSSFNSSGGFAGKQIFQARPSLYSLYAAFNCNLGNCVGLLFQYIHESLRSKFSE